MSAHSSTPLQRQDTRRRLMETALRLSARIGHRKTTVADIAREMSMSPGNVYRFFRSKRAIDEAVVGELVAETVVRAIEAARRGGSTVERLRSVLRAIDLGQAWCLANDKLHDLVVAAGQEGWAVIVEHRQRLTRIVSWVIASGQMRGEFRSGDPIVLARCVLAAMDGYSDPSAPPDRAVGSPTREQMMDFCLSAIRGSAMTSGQAESRAMQARLH